MSEVTYIRLSGMLKSTKLTNYIILSLFGNIPVLCGLQGCKNRAHSVDWR